MVMRFGGGNTNVVRDAMPPQQTSPSILDQYVQEYMNTQRGRAGLDRRYQVVSEDQARSNASAVFSQFDSQFRNLVGRDPNEDERSQFYNQVLRSNKDFGSVYTPGASESGTLFDLLPQTQAFVSGNFQRSAEEQALAELESQKAQANSLAELFRTQGRTAIADTEKSLLDYQSRLFERLRPQLMVSLQSQGLLNTGGLNEALAGQQADLANEAGRYVADLNYQNDTAANQIAFGGQQAPYLFQQGQALNRVPWMQQQGQNALQTSLAQRQGELDFTRQLQLLQTQAQMQRDMRPSFLSNLGNSFVTSAGNSLGQWFGPSGAKSAASAGLV